jgi:hypothetical protein
MDFVEIWCEGADWIHLAVCRDRPEVVKFKEITFHDTLIM